MEGIPPLPPEVENLILTRLFRRLDELDFFPSPLFSHQAICRDLVIQELQRIQVFLAPTTITEMHLARHSGILQGCTSEERYQDFVQRVLRDLDWGAEYFQAYPLLGRRITIEIGHWTDAIGEVVTAIYQDYEELLCLLTGERTVWGQAGIPRPLVSGFRALLGDPHRCGRSVSLVTFSDGRRAIYKPRRLAVDRAFSSLVKWVNQCGLSVPLPVIPVLDRGNHGWYPFLSSAACTDREAVGRFYRRQGSHLALLHVLGGYDQHSENILAAGEYPVLLDLECISSPRLPYGSATYGTLGNEFLRESVQEVGFLPDWQWGRGLKAGINIGALTGLQGQLPAWELKVWVNPGRDDIHQSLITGSLEQEDMHLPLLEGRRVPANEFLEELGLGFAEAYAILETHKEELLAEDSPLEHFRDVPIRVVLRGTRDYAMLREELLHPRYNQSAIYTDAVLEGLWHSRGARYTAAVVQSEIDQMWNYDVPYFETRGDSCTLTDGFGRQLDDGYFDESAFVGVRRRLAELSAARCKVQLDMMHRSFAIVGVTGAGVRDGLLEVVVPDSTWSSPAQRDGLIREEIEQIGLRLVGASIRNSEQIAWIGLGMGWDGSLKQRSLDGSLYDGDVGIGLFLLYASAMTGDSTLRESTRLVVEGNIMAGLRNLRSRTHRFRDWSLFSPNAFQYPVSAGYLLQHVDHLWGTHYLSEAMEVIAIWLKEGLSGKPRYDVLTGISGVVLLLCCLCERSGDEDLASLAASYGDVLLANGRTRNGGMYWDNELHPNGVRGLGHGSSGIGWALSRLARLTGKEQYAVAANAALLYDQLAFSPELTRATASSTPVLGTGWCQGEAGIALASTLAGEYLAAPAGDSSSAYRFLALGGVTQGSDCLCHGTIGNLDILLRMLQGRSCDERELESRQMESLWRNSRARGQWRCGGDTVSVSLPGLFTGLAGIGWGLMRYLQPNSVPSVLAFDGPVG